jgi:hypothetical protein
VCPSRSMLGLVQFRDAYAEQRAIGARSLPAECVFIALSGAIHGSLRVRQSSVGLPGWLDGGRHGLGHGLRLHRWGDVITIVSGRSAHFSAMLWSPLSVLAVSASH